MTMINKFLFKGLAYSLLSEYPFFLFCVIILWQNTLFALREWTLRGVAQYTILSLFYAYILTEIVYLCHSKLLKIFFYNIGVIICFVNIYLRFRFSSNISPNVFQLALETNTQEAYEFISNYFWTLSTLWMLVLLMISIFLIIIVEKKKRVVKTSIYGLWNMMSLIIITGGLISFCLFTNLFKCKNVIEVDYWVAKHGAKAMDNISNIVYCIFDLYLCNKEMVKSVASTRHVLMVQNNCCMTDSLNIVLIVGESYIKSHAGVYGYANNTTPYMQEELNNGNLFLFQDVVSPYNVTSKTLRNVFSTNCNSLGESWSDYPFFPTVFRQAGYEVTFWDNQYNPVSREGFDFSLNAYLHSPIISSITYSGTNNQIKEVDGDLVVDFFANDVSRKGRLRFSIFHLMGQHVAYYNRFPHGGVFDYYNADSIRREDDYLNKEKLQIIADYDNATRYNDYVIYSIIQHYRQSNTILVYFSDHGEEVYDYQDYYGRNWKEPLSEELLRYQFEVPFMVWCSNSYIDKNPEIIGQLRDAIYKPFMLDNVCHLLFHIGRIQSQFYKPERDILNDCYICPPRIVNEKYEVEKVKKSNFVD